MALVKFVALFLVFATTVLAAPRYIAIPLNDLERIGLVAQPMYQRPVFAEARSFNFEPETAETAVQEEYVQAPTKFITEEDRPKRESVGYGSDHVDYGAYTGSHGAFGWYTDHPVGGHHH